MSNLGIIIGREYMTRVKKKSFIILTILMPFLIAGIAVAPMMLGMIKDDAKKDVAVLDQTGKYIKLFVNPEQKDSTDKSSYSFIPADRPLADYQKEDCGVEAVVYINDDLAANPSAVKIYSSGEIQHELQTTVENILIEKIREDKLASYDIPQLHSIMDDISNVQHNFSVQTVKWAENGKEAFSSSEIAMLLGLFSALLIYMFVISYGAMVMQGVMEEKTNRIVEIIVGSVRPFDLMMGKIIGVMLVGFTQIFIWALMLSSIMMIVGTTFGVSSGAIDTDTMVQGMQTAQTQAAIAAMENNPGMEMMAAFNNMPLLEIAVMFILYFLGGYILYSSFYAAIGAAVNSQEDSSQFMMPMIIVMVFALYAAMGSMENTDGPLAFWASLFPLTSPVVMMVRLPFGVPLWQELLSLGLLYGTAILFVWISARIYRVGILMYGKKPTLKEMIKWMRYK